MNSKLKQLKQSEEAKVFNLADWRKNRLHALTLPSGLQVQVRDVTLTDLMMTGKLPAAFVEMAEDANKQGANAVDMKKLVANGAEFRLMLDALAEIALVSPRIGAVADDEHVTLDELPNDDKMAIFNFVNREVEQIKSFREGQSEPVAVV